MSRRVAFVSHLVAIDLLGPFLKDLLNFCNRKFSLKTVLLLADQLVCNRDDRAWSSLTLRLTLSVFAPAWLLTFTLVFAFLAVAFTFAPALAAAFAFVPDLAFTPASTPTPPVNLL